MTPGPKTEKKKEEMYEFMNTMWVLIYKILIILIPDDFRDPSETHHEEQLDHHEESLLRLPLDPEFLSDRLAIFFSKWENKQV